MNTVRIFSVSADIEAIGAKAGQYVLDDGGPVLCVMHEVPRATLTQADASKLAAVGAAPQTKAGGA